MFFSKNYKLFSEASDVREELQKIKDKYLKVILDNIETIITDDDMVCPVCSATHEETIKSIVSKKKATLNQLSNELIKTYCEENRNTNPNDVIEKINAIINFKIENNVDENTAISYLITGGDDSKLSDFRDSSISIEALNQEIAELETQRNQFYNKLKLAEDKIKSLFCNDLQVKEEKIVLDDNQKLLKIILDRDVKTYSTGEINLIVLIINLYQFIYSDKEILVLDDPLSSYDIVNQYRIIFEIVNSINNNKKILVLTHNIEAISMLNSQYRGKFQVLNVEKRGNIETENKELVLNDIFIEEASPFNIGTIIKENENNILIKYVKLLIEREDNDDANIHLVYHYDNSHTYIDINGLTYKNDDLVNLIDNFTNNTLQNQSFYENAFNKIIYLCALRVWIEKQFFDQLNGDPNLENKTLSQKINYIFDEGTNRWTGNSKVNKNILMSKKVMLNHTCHYQSQSAPFYYALNLSLYDISKEIISIKDMFAQLDLAKATREEMLEIEHYSNNTCEPVV